MLREAVTRFCRGRSNISMRKRRILTSVSMAGVIFSCLAARVQAMDVSSKTWTNSTDVSAVNATGNTHTQTLKAADTFHQEWTRILLELHGSALGSSDRNSVTAEEYTAD